MKFYSNLEKKIRKWMIPHLITYVIAAYAIGLVLYYVAPVLLAYLTLEPYYILHGQIWRLISWIFIPTDVSILSIIMLLFYYYVGTQLEQYWGTFRFNLYMFEGLIFTDVASFILYFVYYAFNKTPSGFGWAFSTSYINLSLFLAFAACFPEEKVYVYFILPVKMKWLALIYLVITGYELVVYNWIGRVAIIAALLNFFIFYLSTKNMYTYAPKQIHRRAKYQRQVQSTPEFTNAARHKCVICGRTEKDDPTLTFRFCSKCDGNYEYCQDHLFTHEHIKF